MDKLRVVLLMTGTNNVPPITDTLSDLGHEVLPIVYDEMTHADHALLPTMVERGNPDFVIYIGALPSHHGRPVPTTDILAQIGAKRLLVMIAFDGAEIYWQSQLMDYYDNGRFALMVNIDGVRTGPVGDRGLTLLAPIDASKFKAIPWSDRPLHAGFSGGMHAGRPDIVYPLRDRDLLVYRPRDSEGPYEPYKAFLEACRVSLNAAVTGGVIGGLHVKYRVLESAAAGCLVLEQKDSPLRYWFDRDIDYKEYDGVDSAAGQIQWAKDNPIEARETALRMRAKVVENHSPAVFWSQVTERLGFGRALRKVKEVPYRAWDPAYVPPRFGGDPLPQVASERPIIIPVAAANGAVIHRDPTPPPVSGPPLHLGAFRRVNFVGYNGKVYAVHQSEGLVDIATLANLDGHPTIRPYPNIATAQRAIMGLR